MNWKLITLEDYPMLCEWWQEWGWTPPKPSNLTQDGILVFKNNVPVFAGWILNYGADMMLLEYIVSNKSAEKSGAFKYLLEVASVIAKYNGASHLLHMTPNEKMAEMFKANDWIVTDNNCTHLIKNLWEQ